MMEKRKKALRCVPLRCKSLSELKRIFTLIHEKHFDSVEIWIDDLAEWKRAKKSIAQQVKVLDAILRHASGKIIVKCSATPLQATFDLMLSKKIYAVDIGIRSAKKLILPKKKSSRRPSVIISHHPNKLELSDRELTDYILEMKNLGADIPKLIPRFSAKHEDVQLRTLMNIFREFPGPMIVHPAGEGSQQSRLILSTSGSHITYIAVSASRITAKGQQYLIPRL